MTASVTTKTQPAGSAPVSTQSDLEADQRKRRRKAIVLLILLAGLLILLLLFGWYLIFRQPINPIPPIPVSQLPKYSASIYGVTRPVGVAVSPSGDRIYVTQGATISEALVLDNGGKAVGTMKVPGASGDRQPVYEAVDPKTGDVYVTDRFTGAIFIFSRDGAFVRQFKPTPDQSGWQPLGLAFDGDGNLYVTDLAASAARIVVFDRTGKMTRSLGEDERLNFPNGIAVEKDGTIIVADSNNGRLLTFDKDGKATVRVGRGAGQGLLGVPRGLMIDDKGRIFAVDTTGQHIAVYRDPGNGKAFDFLGVFGDQGAGEGRFNFPSSIALDTRGRVYVTDTFNDRVQVWAY